MVYLASCILLLFFNLVNIDAISYCCEENNTITLQNLCANGKYPKELSCVNETYIIHKDDEELILAHDENENLLIDDQIITPDEYCLTTMLSKQKEIYIICPEDQTAIVMSRQINTGLQLVSVFFIILTVIVYTLVPQILCLQDVCLIHSISGLAFGYLMMAIINLSEYLETDGCHLLAYLSYFSFMYSFFWLNILSFHIWRHIVYLPCLRKIQRWNIIYHIYGIGAPTLALCWVILLNHGNFEGLESIHPGIGYSICWFETLHKTVIFFYGPLTVLLVLNIIFFIWTVAVLWQQSKNCPKLKIFKYRVRMCVKLSVIMGLTWVFEILSVAFNDKNLRWMWIITDILNALQGVIIFLILVVFRKKIKRAFANRKIFGWRLPAYWKNDKDSECEELEEAEISLDNKSFTKVNI